MCECGFSDINDMKKLLNSQILFWGGGGLRRRYIYFRDGSRFSNILFNSRISIRLCDYFLKVYQGLTIKTVRWREGRSDLSLARSGHCRWSLNCIICMRF